VYYKNRVFTNIQAGNVSFQGQTYTEVDAVLAILRADITDKTFLISLPLKDITGNPIAAKATTTVRENALEIIKKEDTSPSFWTIPFYFLTNSSIAKEISKDIVLVDTNTLQKDLTEELQLAGFAKKDFNIEYKNGKFSLVSGKDGFAANLESIEKDILTQRETQKIESKVQTVRANMNPVYIESALTKAATLKERLGDTIAFSYSKKIYGGRQQKSITVGKEDFLKTIGVDINTNNNTVTLKPEIDRLRTLLDTAYIDSYMPPIDGVMQQHPVTGKVTLFAPPHDGDELDLERLSLDLQTQLKKVSSQSATQYIYAKIENKSVPPKRIGNEYGIQELLGSGYSSFKGSTYERRANILNGIEKIHGLLIKPGEIFSLNGALAPYTHENGYIDGLVIKGRKIVPEVGGGMCQVGTTVFRAAMNSGLPIKERVNHSLWVSYYNDPRNGNPGTDATLYEGVADLKFENNTGAHMLIMVRHESNDALYIDLWGTSDGRLGNFSTPSIFKTYPYSQETKTNYVSELPTGKKVCNGPFKGASAVFTYTIKDKEGKITTQNFYSYYRPQELICQIGQ
jgi:vancomycin resistance protein YoaR